MRTLDQESSGSEQRTAGSLNKVRCHRTRAVEHKIPLALAALMGAVHFLIVGIPFIQAHGGGERLLYILLVDSPPARLANALAPKLYYNSVTFHFWLFPVLGTIMYAAFGYCLGLLVVLVKKMVKQI